MSERPITSPQPIVVDALRIVAEEAVTAEATIERVWQLADRIALDVVEDGVAFRGDVRTSAATVRRRIHRDLLEALGPRPLA